MKIIQSVVTCDGDLMRFGLEKRLCNECRGNGFASSEIALMGEVKICPKCGGSRYVGINVDGCVTNTLPARDVRSCYTNAKVLMDMVGTTYGHIPIRARLLNVCPQRELDLDIAYLRQQGLGRINGFIITGVVGRDMVMNDVLLFYRWAKIHHLPIWDNLTMTVKSPIHPDYERSKQVPKEMVL